MKNKWIMVLLSSTIAIVAGCTQNATTDTTSSQEQVVSSIQTESTSTTKSEVVVDPKTDVSTFVDQYMDANQKVTTVQLDTEANIILFGSTAGGKGKFLYEFAPSDQALKNYFSQSTFVNPDTSLETYFIYSAPDRYYYKNDADQWEVVPSDQVALIQQIGIVSYVDIYNSLANILTKEKGKYEIHDAPKAYEIVITDKTFEAKKYLAGIIDLTLVDIEENELEKEITYKVNKETLLFEAVDIKLYYEGENGKIDIHSNFTASGWNTVDTSIFKEVNQ